MGGRAPEEGAGVGALRHQGRAQAEQACGGLGPLPELHLPFCGAGQGSTALPGAPGKSTGRRREEDRGGMCPRGGLRD